MPHPFKSANMTENEDLSGVRIFLDSYLGTRGLGNNNTASFPNTPRVGRSGLKPSGNEQEPLDTYFAEAMWAERFEETSSSSGLSMEDDTPIEMLLAYPPSGGSRSMTDTSSVHTPEPLVTTDEFTSIFSTSPSSPGGRFRDTGSSIDLNALRGLDDRLTIPVYDAKQSLPRPPTLDLPARPIKRSPNSRHRVVKNVDKVNKVRDAGACIRCRVQKVTCSAINPCETCKKLGQQTTEFSCIRGDLTSVAKELSPRRFAGLKLDHIVNNTLRTASPQFLGPIFEGRILLEPDSSRPGLEVTLRNYTCAASNHGGCTFTRNPENRALTQDGLVDWASQYVSSEDHRTFEGRLEHFIKQYGKPSHCNPYSTAKRPKTELLQKVHTLHAMCKIYRSPTLFFIRSGEIRLSELSLPAQAEIRGIAKSVIESSERDILADLDRYLKPTKSKIDNHERPAVWAALWQLMFIYRDLLRNVKPWHGNAEPLLNAVAVFYASLFRTSAALKLLSLDSVKGHWPAGETQQVGLTKAFDSILELRDTFHQRIAAGVDAIDQRLKVLVVDPEMKVLKRRPAPKKQVSAKRGASGQCDEDEIMTGY
ncbi:uncharacterized protein CCOS01_08012 [Colletotrichum costaricense]|uniref:Zn(2)-C6 fungal-type domain-containing protein n=1 Tax=Colletotrichum costaricense TaxID=1209916 RepID=A0AAI9YXN2_9PEZI|nr:uncharacterized protein CCOS01_08012 [Colletotrichum costaricense]KAK1527750.1 hypothetical protein CCOS01_08012 [Colletotrichum costaricense]